MYNPYENYNQNDLNGQKPSVPGSGADNSTPGTTQKASEERPPVSQTPYTKITTPSSVSYAGSPASGFTTQTASGGGTAAGNPVSGNPTGAVPNSGTAYSYQPGQSGQAGAYGQGNPASPTPSYTWNTSGSTPQGPYYTPHQPQAKPPKQKKKGRGGKTLLKVLAGVVCCAVISVSSVGVFALMIQNGVVDIRSNGSNQTAAFTINKVVDDGTDSSNVNTISGQLTPQEIAEKLIPSVVCIQNFQMSQNNFMFGGMGGTETQDGDSYSDMNPTSQGSGIIFSKDGYIVTNAHVVDGATSLKVVTSDGLSYEATVVGSDSMTDLAVIKIEADKDLTPAEFGTSEDLKVADEVMAIGNPGGIQFNSSVTMGYVSALNRQVTNSETGFTMGCVQTDAAINPGNSGGALVDMYGHVVGINSSKIVATGYEGLGFAIPAETAQPIISDLIEYGYVKDRAMLGISGRYIDSMIAQFYGLTAGMGVEAVNSPEAKAAGLQAGDVITAIDGTQITSSTTISAYIANKKPGETVKLSVVRSSTGETLELEVELSKNTGEG